MSLLTGVATLCLDCGGENVTLDRVQKVLARQEVQWQALDGSPAKTAQPAAALPVLKETAQAEDAQTRLRGIEGLAQTNVADNIDVFLRALTDSSPEVRELAARTLVAQNSPRLFEAVMNVLCGGTKESVAALDNALPLLRESLEKKLLEVLDATGEPPPRKMAAAYALGKMKSTAAVADLAALAESPDPMLASYCLQALISIPDVLVLQSLAKLAANPAPGLRLSAVQGMATIVGPEATEALARVAMEPPVGDVDLSRRAVGLLAERKDDTVVPLLIDVLRRNLEVRRAAVDALRRVTGEDLGDDPKEWHEWYQDKLKERAKAPSQKPGFDAEYLPEE